MADELDTSTVPVQRMGPGDHAFARYGADGAGWDVLASYVHQGLVRREKVLVLAAPQLPEDLVRERLAEQGAALAAAIGRGQLVLTGMRALIHPHRRFTHERQWQRITEETESALAQGHRGLRTFIDMHWVADLEADVEAMMYRESHAEHLFTGRPYTEICSYDERAFAPDVLAAMRRAHPRQLLDRLGVFTARHGPGTLRLIGEADLATREPFIAALRGAFARTAAARRLRVDLTPLAFLSVGCAADILAQSARSAHERIELHCTADQARILKAVGAGQLTRLELTEGGHA